MARPLSLVIALAAVVLAPLSVARADDSIYVTHCGDYDLVGRIRCPMTGRSCSIVLFETSMAESEVMLRGPVAALRSYDGHRMRIRAEITGLDPLVARASPRAARAGLVTGTPADARLITERDCATTETVTPTPPSPAQRRSFERRR